MWYPMSHQCLAVPNRWSYRLEIIYNTCQDNSSIRLPGSIIDLVYPQVFIHVESCFYCAIAFNNCQTVG